MAGGSSKVVVSAQVRMELQNQAKIMQEVKTSLQNAIASVDGSSALGKSFTKLFDQVESRSNKISNLLNKEIFSEQDLVKVASLMESISDSFGEIGRKIQGANYAQLGLETEEIIEAKKALDAFEKRIISLKSKTAAEALGKWPDELKKLIALKDQIDFNPGESLTKNIGNADKALRTTRGELAELVVTSDEAKESLEAVQEKLRNLEVEKSVTQSKLSIRTNRNAELAQQFAAVKTGTGKSRTKENVFEDYSNILNSWIDSTTQNFTAEGQIFSEIFAKWLTVDYSTLGSSAKEIVDNLTKALESQLRGSNGKLSFDAVKTWTSKILAGNMGEVDSGVTELKQTVQTIDNTITATTAEVVDATNAVADIESQIQKAQDLITTISAQLEKLRQLRKEYEKLIDDEHAEEKARLQANSDLAIEGVEGPAHSTAAQKVRRGQNSALAVSNIKDASIENRKLQEEAQREADNFKSNLKQSISHWLSAQMIITKIREGIHQAWNDIQGLDKAMTNIAVVTDMSVSDLWGKINEYMAIAQDYGVTTQGVYEVSQLYYQQGLSTNEVMEATTETLKMARIAGMDYAEAADAMTVAIRAFKMEMSDAQIITDVYSKVAAVTASDSQELAIAMSKTASSAESVGSSFENTTAMLAVMIETTRESAQNLGSALKSIISRYGEMKTGLTVDSEGEAIDYNKVDTALQSIGISIKDAQGQFRDFDDVIFDLSKKWDSLDKNTQRYIATIMAGNRQQSRFIALVDNWERLEEVSAAAYDSEDAGLLQYAKTLDSLETKLNALSTSFQQFYMNIVNGGFFKGIVDIITNFLNGLNELGTLNGILNIATLIHGLKIGLTTVVTVFANSFGEVYKRYKELQKKMTSLAIKEGSQRGQASAQAEATAMEQTTQIKRRRRNRQNGVPITSKEGIDKTAAFSLAASILGTVASSLGTIVLSSDNLTKKSKAGDRWTNNVAGSLLSTAGNITSGAATGAMIGNAIPVVGAAAGGIIGGLIPAITGLADITKALNNVEQERYESLTKQSEELNVQRAESKNDFNTLVDLFKKYDDAEKNRYNSAEDYQEWLNINNQLVESYPELLSYIDAEGNAIADVTKKSELLATSMTKAAEASYAYYEAEISSRKQKIVAAEKTKFEAKKAVSGVDLETQKYYEEFASIDRITGSYIPANYYAATGEDIYNWAKNKGLDLNNLLVKKRTNSLEEEEQIWFEILENLGVYQSNNGIYSLHESLITLISQQENEREIKSLEQRAAQEGLSTVSKISGMDDKVEKISGWSSLVEKLAINQGSTWESLANITAIDYEQIISGFTAFYSGLNKKNQEIIDSLYTNLNSYSLKELSVIGQETGLDQTDMFKVYQDEWYKINTEAKYRLIKTLYPQQEIPSYQQYLEEVGEDGNYQDYWENYVSEVLNQKGEIGKWLFNNSQQEDELFSKWFQQEKNYMLDGNGIQKEIAIKRVDLIEQGLASGKLFGIDLNQLGEYEQEFYETIFSENSGSTEWKNSIIAFGKKIGLKIDPQAFTEIIYDNYNTIISEVIDSIDENIEDIEKLSQQQKKGFKFSEANKLLTRLQQIDPSLTWEQIFTYNEEGLLVLQDFQTVTATLYNDQNQLLTESKEAIDHAKKVIKNENYEAKNLQALVGAISFYTEGGNDGLEDHVKQIASILGLTDSQTNLLFEQIENGVIKTIEDLEKWLTALGLQVDGASEFLERSTRQINGQEAFKNYTKTEKNFDFVSNISSGFSREDIWNQYSANYLDNLAEGTEITSEDIDAFFKDSGMSFDYTGKGTIVDPEKLITWIANREGIPTDSDSYKKLAAKVHAAYDSQKQQQSDFLRGVNFEATLDDLFQAEELGLITITEDMLQTIRNGSKTVYDILKESLGNNTDFQIGKLINLDNINTELNDTFNSLLSDLTSVSIEDLRDLHFKTTGIEANAGETYAYFNAIQQAKDGNVELLRQYIIGLAQKASLNNFDIDFQNINNTLADTAQELALVIFDNLESAIEGTLSATNMHDLSQKLNIDVERYAQATIDGYKVTTDGMLKLGTEMMKQYGETYSVAEKMFDLFVGESGVYKGYRDIVKAAVELDKTADKTTAEYKAQKKLLTDMAKIAMFNPDDPLFNFMDQDPSRGMALTAQSMVDTIDKVKDAFSTLKDGENIAATDFYNMMDFMYDQLGSWDNFANALGISDATLAKLDISTTEGANIYEKFVNAIVSQSKILGEVDADVLMNLGLSAENMADGMSESLKAVADDQIKQLEAMKTTLLAMKELENLDINLGSLMQIDGKDVFLSNFTEFLGIDADTDNKIIDAVNGRITEIKDKLFTKGLTQEDWNKVFGIDGEVNFENKAELTAAQNLGKFFEFLEGITEQEATEFARRIDALDETGKIDYSKLFAQIVKIGDWTQFANGLSADVQAAIDTAVAQIKEIEIDANGKYKLKSGQKFTDDIAQQIRDIYAANGYQAVEVGLDGEEIEVHIVDAKVKAMIDASRMAENAIDWQYDFDSQTYKATVNTGTMDVQVAIDKFGSVTYTDSNGKPVTSDTVDEMLSNSGLNIKKTVNGENQQMQLELTAPAETVDATTIIAENVAGIKAILDEGIVISVTDDATGKLETIEETYIRLADTLATRPLVISTTGSTLTGITSTNNQNEGEEQKTLPTLEQKIKVTWEGLDDWKQEDLSQDIKRNFTNKNGWQQSGLVQNVKVNYEVGTIEKPNLGGISGGGTGAQATTPAVNATGNVNLLKLGAAYARGTLMGELGPELYVQNGAYHIAGAHGPEFVDLDPDAIVFNHLQTANLLGKGHTSKTGSPIISERRSVAFATGNVSGPAMASGLDDAIAAIDRAIAMWQNIANSTTQDLLSGSGKHKGGGSGNTLKAVTEELQEWYNLTRQIRDLEDEITNLQKERANIPEADGEKYLKSLREEQKLLNQQMATQQALLDYQELQLKRQADHINQNRIWSQFLTVGEDGLLQYIEGNETNGGKGALQVLQELNQMSAEQQTAYLKSIGYSYTDNDGNKLEGTELVEKFFEEMQAQIDQYDSLYDTVHQTEGILEDLQKDIQAISDQIKENQMELEQAVFDIIVEAWEKEIEQMEEQADLIKEANEAYINGLNEALSAERQMYDDNQKTADREQLQRRLSLLRRSGGSASEIADLEEQLNDMLKDEYFSNQERMIEDIQQANDIQVQQLETQINLQKEALEYQKEHGVIWTQVYEVLSKSRDEILAFMQGNSTEFFSQSLLQQEQMLIEWAHKIGIYKEDQKYQNYANHGRETLWDNGQAWNLGDMSKYQTTYNNLTDEEKNAIRDQFTSVYANARLDGKSHEEAAALAAAEVSKTLKRKQDSNNAQNNTPPTTNPNPQNPGGGDSGNDGNSGGGTGGSNNENPNEMTHWKFTYNGKTYKHYKSKDSAISKMQALGREYLAANPGSMSKVREMFEAAKKTLKSGKHYAQGYSRGGLVDYTGIAMVHGSKTRPESFLNAEQTAQIREGLETTSGKSSALEGIKDTLLRLNSSIQSLTNITNKTESNTYTIAPGAVVIQVEQLNDAYDVDTLSADIMNRMYAIGNKSTNRGVSRR